MGLVAVNLVDHQACGHVDLQHNDVAFIGNLAAFVIPGAVGVDDALLAGVNPDNVLDVFFCFPVGNKLLAVRGFVIFLTLDVVAVPVCRHFPYGQGQVIAEGRVVLEHNAGAAGSDQGAVDDQVGPFFSGRGQFNAVAVADHVAPDDNLGRAFVCHGDAVVYIAFFVVIQRGAVFLFRFIHLNDFAVDDLVAQGDAVQILGVDFFRVAGGKFFMGMPVEDDAGVVDAAFDHQVSRDVDVDVAFQGVHADTGGGMVTFFIGVQGGHLHVVADVDIGFIEFVIAPDADARKLLGFAFDNQVFAHIHVCHVCVFVVNALTGIGYLGFRFVFLTGYFILFVCISRIDDRDILFVINAPSGHGGIVRVVILVEGDRSICIHVCCVFVENVVVVLLGVFVERALVIERERHLIPCGGGVQNGFELVAPCRQIIHVVKRAGFNPFKVADIVHGNAGSAVGGNASLDINVDFGIVVPDLQGVFLGCNVFFDRDVVFAVMLGTNADFAFDIRGLHIDVGAVQVIFVSVFVQINMAVNGSVHVIISGSAILDRGVDAAL